MNRRQLIKTFGALGVFSALGYKVYDIFHTPDFTFLKKKLSLLAEVSETIIPQTDTPGAKDANVAAFVVYAVEEILGRQEQNTFIDGLKQLDSYSKSTYGKPFESCSAVERMAALNYMKDGYQLSGFLAKVKQKLLGNSFVEILRELVVVGYCTSEVGATQGLAYELVPGNFISCTQILPNQKSWATK